MAIAAPKTLSESATREQRPNPLPILLLVVGMIAAAGFGVWSYYASRATERVVILARDIAAGQQITQDDLAVIEVSRYRPVQIAGITDPASLVGTWTTRDLGANDYAQPSMFAAEPPAEPVYPNGRKLTPNMVPVPFAVASAGPISDRDRLNILLITADERLCAGAGEGGGGGAVDQGKPFACRFLTDVQILYLDGTTAYLELTPYQAHAMWSLQAAGVSLLAERYGATSDPLLPMTRLEAGDITVEELMAPAPAYTGERAPKGAIDTAPATDAPATDAPATDAPATSGEAAPAATAVPIPGAGAPIPGAQPTAAPATEQP